MISCACMHDFLYVCLIPSFEAAKSRIKLNKRFVVVDYFVDRQCNNNNNKYILSQRWAVRFRNTQATRLTVVSFSSESSFKHI